MATIDQLMQAFSQFGNAAKEYGAAQGIRDATDQVQQLNQAADLDFQQRYAAQQQIAQGLQGRLAGLGVNGTAIAQAVSAVAPPKIGTSAEALAAAQSARTPEDAKTLAELSTKLSKAEGENALAGKKPEMDAKFENDRDLLAMRLGAEGRAVRGALTSDQMLRKQERDELVQIPGFELTPGFRPRPEEATNLRKGVAVADQMFNDLSRLRELVKQKGSFELGGAEAGEMSSLATGIALSAKEAENLGVLNGKDYEILTKLVPQTDNLGSFFTRDKTALKKLDMAIERTTKRVEAEMKTRGYKSQAANQLEAAQQWLKENPNDPRAADVRARIENQSTVQRSRIGR